MATCKSCGMQYPVDQEKLIHSEFHKEIMQGIEWKVKDENDENLVKFGFKNCTN